MALHSILPRLTSNMFYRVRYFKMPGKTGPSGGRNDPNKSCKKMQNRTKRYYINPISPHKNFS